MSPWPRTRRGRRPPLRRLRRAAETFQGVLRADLPDALGIGRYSVAWIIIGRPIRGRLWDDVLAPLTAGAAGALTTALAASPSFGLRLGPAGVLTVLVVAAAGALPGTAAVRGFPYVHGVFRRLRHPMPRLPAGGVAPGRRASWAAG